MGHSFYFGEFLSAESVRRHELQWAAWVRWATARGETALPARPHAVARFIAGLPWKMGSVDRYAYTIRFRHRAAGHDDPIAHETVRQVLSHLRRTRGAHRAPAQALTADLLLRVLPALRWSLEGFRDAAMLLVGWAAALRGAELAALRREWLDFRPEGLVLRLPTSKTGAGVIAIPATPAYLDGHCPMEAVDLWLTATGLVGDGPLWAHCRQDSFYRRGYDVRSVRRRIGSLCRRAGIPGHYTSHSLRAGLVTTLARAGVSDLDIARITRHRSMRVLRDYIRDYADPFDHHPLKGPR